MNSENSPQPAGDAPKAAAAQPALASPASPAPPSPALAKPRSKRPLIILTVVILVILIVGGYQYWQGRNYQSTDDAFIDGHVVQISPRVAASVVAVYFHDNQEVKKGDLLMELDPRDFTVAVTRAEAELAQAHAQAQQFHAQARQALAQAAQAKAQLAQAEAQVTQQTAQFEVAGINFNRNQALYQRDLRAVSKQEVDTTKSAFDASRAAYNAAQANVEGVRAAGAAAEAQADAAEAQAKASEAAAGSAQANLENARLQLSYTKIHAPEDGQITRKSVEPGNYVQVSQTLSSLVRHDVWVTANFKETQLTRMKRGQPVEVSVDAYPGHALKAHVDSFQAGTGARFSLLPAENATGNFVKVVQRVPVKIVFDEQPEALLHLAPGMSAEPKVSISVEPQNPPADSPPSANAAQDHPPAP